MVENNKDYKEGRRHIKKVEKYAQLNRVFLPFQVHHVIYHETACLPYA